MPANSTTRSPFSGPATIYRPFVCSDARSVRIFAAALDGRAARSLTRSPARPSRTQRPTTLTELDAALERELRGQSVLLRSHDFIEGATAFQQRRTPNFTDR
jgi:enoyl-CoA hydratase